MPATGSLVAAAEELLDGVMADPWRVRGQAERLLVAARRAGDGTARVVAYRVLGLAARECHEPAAAVGHLRRSVALAVRHRLPRRAAECRMSLALALDDLGRPAAAIREIDRAVAGLTGVGRARATMQRAIILRRIGREEEALRAYDQALVAFRRTGDTLWQARALTNRGVLRAYRGAVAGAERDLRAAERLYADLGQDAAVAQVRHNLGFVAAQAGDVPRALAWYDRADVYFRRNGRPAVAILDRAELLMSARLWPEARQAAREAAQASAGSRMGLVLPQARLLEAQGALATGDAANAMRPAAEARRVFRRQGRHRWAALAGYVVWQATESAQPAGRRLAGVRRVAASLADAGWTEQALQARIHAAELALDRPPGPRTTAITELAQAVAVIPRGPARLRARAWYGRALVRLHDGDRAGAKRALLAGMRVVDAYRAVFGAAELRAHSTAEGTHTARLGLRLAVDDGRPREVLAWAERGRATALAARQPALDVAANLARLRRVTMELAATDLDADRAARLLRQQRALEDEVRRRTWHLPGDGRSGGPDHAVADTCAALGLRALVEFVQLDGTLLAVVATGRRVRLRALGPAAEAATEAAALRFATRRLALRHGSAAALTAARTAAGHAIARLDDLLLRPLRPLVGDHPLVIVPTGTLHDLAWPLLPTCQGRPVTVAPSAYLWRTALARRTPPGRTLLVAAPEPPHAAGEVALIAAGAADATVLVGSRARVPDVLAGLDGAATAHVAAHGTFRADNPLFSHLSLADGPLTVHDLLPLRRPPGLLMLSACDSGVSTVHEGDELMGFTAALLGLGTRTIIASVGPVDDEATRALMVDLHRRLAGAVSPAEALAAAQAAMADDALSGTHAFLCFGAS